MKFKSSAPMPAVHHPWQLGGSYRHTIGVVEPCYGSGHVIYGLPREKYTHMEVLTAPLKALDGKTTFHAFTPFILDLSIPLIHTWNAIPRNRDFIVSFELELPRYLHAPSDEQLRRGMELLRSSRCKAILALSDFAYGFAKNNFAKHGFPDLVDKMSVFRGAIIDPLDPQGIPERRSPRASFADKPFSAVVIGTDLFRKGGMYAIQAFENLRARGFEVDLTLIGDFGKDSYVFKNYLPNADEWRDRAKSHSWIKFSGAIPNAQVFDVLRAHDICLYPSLDESLGWLIIEAGMLGVPVLGNRLCAFPELIKHQQTGWLVDLPQRDNGRWIAIDRPEILNESLDEANDLIVKGIEDCVEYVHRNPDSLAEWGRNGRDMMKRLYGMEAAGRELERIYDTVLEGRALEPLRDQS